MFNITKILTEGAFGGFSIVVEKADNGLIANVSGNINNQTVEPKVFETKSKKLLFTGTAEEIKQQMDDQLGIGKFLEV